MADHESRDSKGIIRVTANYEERCTPQFMLQVRSVQKELAQTNLGEQVDDRPQSNEQVLKFLFEIGSVGGTGARVVHHELIDESDKVVGGATRSEVVLVME